MKCIIGLGNPGSRYNKTWHNIGFMVIDELATKHSSEAFKLQKRFNANVAIGKIGTERVICAKPETFMNMSGTAASTIAHYYKVHLEDIIIIHDDLDLPLGTIRISYDASSGGHNGIKSIIEELRSQKFIRLRIGVRTERLSTVGATEYVLEKIPKDLQRQMTASVKLGIEAIETIINSSTQEAMQKYN